MNEDSLFEVKCEASDKESELEKRRELLKEILDRDPDNPIFEKVFEFYRQLFNKNQALTVFMCRKSWRVVHLFLPLLKAEGIDVDPKKMTHDRMVQPWFAELEQNKPGQAKEIKVYVVDDSLQTGRALDDCVRRLVKVYKVDKKNLTVAVFAITDNKYNRRRIDADKNLYTVSRSSFRKMDPFEVNWGGGKAFYGKEDASVFSNFYSKNQVSLFSYLFVEALHACSEPYVGYIPAFRLPIDVVQKRLGAYRGKDVRLGASDISVPGYLEQEDLKAAPFNDPAKVGYYNITGQQMRQHDVEAFYLSLSVLDFDDKDYLSRLLPEYAISIAALRFYLNRKTGIALVVPYLSLKDCNAEAKIEDEFPKELRYLVEEMCEEEEWEEYEGRLAAYRILRYAAGYLWGKYVFKQWFGLDVKKEDIMSSGGICSDTFFGWLNSTSAADDLSLIWPFFAPGKGNVIEKTEIDSGKSFKGIIHRGIPKDEADFSKVIKRSLSVSSPVDYFNTLSMLFRRILEREFEILIANADEEKNVLPEAFHGFPIPVFFALVLLKFPKLKKRRNVLTTVTLMLCDMGIAVTQLQQHDGIIGTVLLNGEQSCHALAPIAPEYSFFISKLPEILREFKKEQRQKKFKMAKTEIKKYFKYEKSKGIDRGFSLKELLGPLKDIRTVALNDKEQDFIAYSALPRTSFFDCSELFFRKLREKITS